MEGKTTQVKSFSINSQMDYSNMDCYEYRWTEGKTNVMDDLIVISRIVL